MMKQCRFVVFFLLLFLVARGEEKPFPFTNSLGMQFVEVPGTQVLFSVYETRVKDFIQFAEAENRDWPQPSFPQGKSHPAVNISWEDAKNFCSWLTLLETEKGYLPEGWRYRLPTEKEWMSAVTDQPFFEDEPGFNPELKFPWGDSWPPPKNAGNYSPELHIEDFPKTAPVGSFLPNVYGIHDMGGNVWEWCEDFFEGARDIRVLKGGSYNMREVTDILITTKIGNVSYIRLPAYGFRVVVEKQ
mgnify:CR=1 FL=1